MHKYCALLNGVKLTGGQCWNTDLIIVSELGLYWFKPWKFNKLDCSLLLFDTIRKQNNLTTQYKDKKKK